MNLTPVVKNLLIINIALFILGRFVPLEDLFALHHVHSVHFMPHQVITYMFLHANLNHILGNMLGLFFLGPSLEQVMGNKRFLTLYMVAGIGGGVLYQASNYVENLPMEQAAEEFYQHPTPQKLDYFVTEYVGYSHISTQGATFVTETYPENPDNTEYVSEATRFIDYFTNLILNIPMVGASGAIFGILFSIAFLFPNVQLQLLFIPIPIRAKYFVTLLGLYEVYTMHLQMTDRSVGDNVAHLAHLGGMVFAFILLKKWGYKRIH